MGRDQIAVRNYESGLDRVLFIMGWGNDFDQPGIRWLVRRLNLDGFSVTAVRIPTDIKDYKRDIIDPVVALSGDMNGPILIAHSFGAVAGRYVTGSRKRTFSSPYWGIPKHRMFPFWKQALTLLQWLGIPIIDRGYGPAEIGDIVEEDDHNLIPRRISIRTIFQVWKAQRAMPGLQECDHIFYSVSDRISDLEAISGASCRKTSYAGGHAFFTSSSRDKTMHDILYDLRPHRSA